MEKKAWIGLLSRSLVVILFIGLLAVPPQPNEAMAEDFPTGDHVVGVTYEVYATPVTGVEILIDWEIPTDDRGAVVLLPGQTASIDHAVYPADATYPNVTWSTANPEIANVDGNGTVTGVNFGRTTLTVTTTDGNYSDTIDIAVVEADAAFQVEFSKGIVGVDEYAIAKVFKTSESHDISHFQIGVSLPEDWIIYGVAPHDNVAEGTFEFNDDLFASGTILDDRDSGGRTELFTLYLQSIGTPGDGEIQLYDGVVTDREGMDHYIGDPGNYSEQIVKFAVPVADANAALAEIIAEHYGETVIWPEVTVHELSEQQAMDMNRDGIIDMKDLTFVHVRALESWYDPDTPEYQDVEFPPID